MQYTVTMATTMMIATTTGTITLAGEDEDLVPVRFPGVAEGCTEKATNK